MKKSVFLEGRRVVLRGITRKDFKGSYFDWLNDGEVTRYLQSGLFPNTPEKMSGLYDSIVKNQDVLFLAIADKKSGKHIGNIKLGPINWVHRFSEYGILIGEKKFWGKGVCREATELLLNHAFRRLNLHRVRLGVVRENVSALESYKKIGFKIEGRAREQFRVDGKYHDVIFMGILDREFLTRRAS